MTRKALIITSIANDQHPVLNTFAEQASNRGFDFILIGDTKSPEKFNLSGCDYYGVNRQLELPFSLASATPFKHYSRKNLGYLLAMKNGIEEIIETDDDNFPRNEFWMERNREATGNVIENAGWVNIYSYFSKTFIWPRGFPLERLQEKNPDINKTKLTQVHCPIQQGLADENPDVDAVYRLSYPLPVNFEIKNRISLGKNAWSPFNSQNTYWFKEAFQLLYLPSYCSFRMTDIWRSYVAQRIAWECGWSILYHEPTVWQERNEHNLMKDFEDEIPGYMNNLKICSALEKLSLKSGKENIAENLIASYSLLVELGVVGKDELSLLEKWNKDVAGILCT